jgi:hypothetical protein
LAQWAELQLLYVALRPVYGRYCSGVLSVQCSAGYVFTASPELSTQFTYISYFFFSFVKVTFGLIRTPGAMMAYCLGEREVFHNYYCYVNKNSDPTN